MSRKVDSPPHYHQYLLTVFRQTWDGLSPLSRLPCSSDLNGDGFVCDYELHDLFREANLPLPGYKVREIIQKLMVEADRDKDNKISFEEFVSVSNSLPRCPSPACLPRLAINVQEVPSGKDISVLCCYRFLLMVVSLWRRYLDGGGQTHWFPRENKVSVKPYRSALLTSRKTEVECQGSGGEVMPCLTLFP